MKRLRIVLSVLLGMMALGCSGYAQYFSHIEKYFGLAILLGFASIDLLLFSIILAQADGFKNN